MPDVSFKDFVSGMQQIASFVSEHDLILPFSGQEDLTGLDPMWIDWLMSGTEHDLTPKRRDIVNEFLPLLTGTSHDRVFSEKAREARDFARDRGFIPRVRDIPKDGDESDLVIARWVTLQRTKWSKQNIAINRVGVLDRFIPGWSAEVAKDSSLVLNPDARPTACVPRSGSTQYGGAPAKLSRNTLSVEVLPFDSQAADVPASTRRHTITLVPSWDEMLVELEQFVCDHRMFPRKNTGHRSERALYRWLTQQRISGANNTLRRAHVEQLNLRVPGWRTRSPKI